MGGSLPDPRGCFDELSARESCRTLASSFNGARDARDRLERRKERVRAGFDLRWSSSAARGLGLELMQCSQEGLQQSPILNCISQAHQAIRARPTPSPSPKQRAHGSCLFPSSSVLSTLRFCTSFCTSSNIRKEGLYHTSVHYNFIHSRDKTRLCRSQPLRVSLSLVSKQQGAIS